MARKKGRHEEEKIKETKENDSNKNLLLMTNGVLAILLLVFLGLTLFLLYSRQGTENVPEPFTNNIKNFVNVYPEGGTEKDTNSSTVIPEQSSTTTTTTQHTTTTREATTTTAPEKTETTETTGSPPASGHETEKKNPDTDAVKVPDNPATTIAQLPGFEPNMGIQQFISPDLADPGDIVEYSLTLINFGQGKALNVIASEVLPEGLTYADTGTRFREWDFGDIEANGAKKNVTYHVEVGSNTSFGAYDNVLTIKADNHNEFNVTNSLNVVSNP